MALHLFPTGHATHPQARSAALVALAQVRAQMAQPGYASAPTLALLYITDHYADDAQEVLDLLSAELPGITDWVGSVGVGVCAGNTEYFDQPALALMLLDIPCDQYRVFSGVAPLLRGNASFAAHTALVHADGEAPELAALLAELADRTSGGYVFGGVAASRGASVQFAVGGGGNLAGHGAAGGVFAGGLSGVAFGAGVPLLSRVTQGCQPVGPVQRITEAAGNVVLRLDDEPALERLLSTLDVSLVDNPEQAIERVRMTLAGLVDDERGGPPAALRGTGHFGVETRVRHIVGLDGVRHGVALADRVESGMQLAFCQRNVQAARADLVRICSEIREELAPADTPPTHAIAGALYVSCSGRGGPHFGGKSAELRSLQHALGEVPLVGFFAGGEIAHARLYGYTGVLTVFLAPV